MGFEAERGLTSLSMQPWLVRFSCRGIMMLSKSRIICSACMRTEADIKLFARLSYDM